MKRLLQAFPAVCVCVVLCSLVCRAQDRTLPAPDSDCAVVVSAQATAQERYAAEPLRRYLSQITGRDVTVGTDGEQAGAAIAVGQTACTPRDVSALPDGGYRIVFAGDTLCIYGAGRKGTLNGVYGFLRDFCGCRWYAADTQVIPQTEVVVVPSDVDVTYKPYFEYAETDWLGSPGNPEYSLANGLNGSMRTLSAEQGGSVRYLGGFCHTLAARFCARDTYFDEHPEYFALHGGKRTPNQLCLTNPDTRRIVTEEVLAVLASQYDPDAGLQIVSVTQDDNGDFCECPACKALDDANGSHAGTMVTFANLIARAVRDAGYSGVLIDTFAYQYTRKTPSAVVPDDNVVIRLCSIECCFCHPLDDDKCKENRDFMRDLRDWGRICERIYIWDYTTNYWETLCLYPDFGVLQRNIQIFYENNARGVFEEGNAGTDCDTEFSQLRAYLLARLMQDPYLDYDAEMRGFLGAYYGEAGEPIYRFLMRTIEKAGKNYRHPLGTFPDSRDTLTAFTASDVTYCDALWEQAKDAVRDTAYLDRTARSEVCWRYWKCCNRRGEYAFFRSTVYTRMAAREALYNDLVRFGVGRTNVARRNRKLTSCKSLILLRRGEKWCALYEEKYWDALEPFVVQMYRFLGRMHGGISI